MIATVRLFNMVSSMDMDSSRSVSPQEGAGNTSNNNNNPLQQGVLNHQQSPKFFVSSGRGSSPNVGTSGVTQSIRAKLNFFDDNKWKRFSARRLELIDKLGLSSRKASEQDDMINEVSEKLRIEYGFPPENHADFDKLVRAAIQSVRRNRKRTQRTLNRNDPGLKRRRSSLDPVANKLQPLEYLNAPDRLSIAALVSTPGQHSTPATIVNNSHGSATPHSSKDSDNSLPPLSKLSLSYRDNFFFSSIDRLGALLRSCSDTISTSTKGDGANLEFLGSAVLSSAVGLAIERKAITNGPLAESIRRILLSYAITAALVKSLGQGTLSGLNQKLALCAMEYGFDPTINCLTNVFYEFVCLNGEERLVDSSNLERLQSLFPMNRCPEATVPPSTVSSVASTTTRYQPQPDVRPVTLRFQDQKFDFTYNPRANSPPTIGELIDNGRSAFKIGPHRALNIKNANRGGRLLVTDSDVAEAFTEMHIDLELFVPEGTGVVRDLRDFKDQSRPVLPKFQELL